MAGGFASTPAPWSPGRVTVRRATADDVAEVLGLEADCLGADAWSPELVRQACADELPTVSCLVSQLGGTVIGYAVCSIAGDIAELQRIAVAEPYRRHGVAAALLAAVVDEARRTTADRLLLEVREDNRGAMAFYAGQGFVEIDRRRRYYADGAAAVVLRRALVRGCGGHEVSGIAPLDTERL